MVRPGRKQRKGEYMKKFAMKWLPMVAVVVVGLIVANEVLPFYNSAKAKIKTATAKTGA